MKKLSKKELTTVVGGPELRIDRRP
ncbi:bacteriocin [Fulvivirga sediminis]|uniref:Bacteriocin n=1 Tax=Fulvivirga sediminis TaxID=2803949 RepID=A0A937K083_9BACT|nr:bacteriocin [Fulvivirga sediminis]